MEDLYDIVRFHFQGDNVVMDTGLTLEEAQEHCQREDTHGDGWFDGYVVADGYSLDDETERVR
jgi:hypothetical protein